MAEQTKASLEELFAKIDEFEKTILQLKDNLAKFKKKLLENMKKFGPDTSKWPQEKSS